MKMTPDFLRKLRFVHRDEGTFPMLAMIMVILLVFTGLAMMKWGADENHDAMLARYKLQAYYAAHAGIMDQGFLDARTSSFSEMTTARQYVARTLLSNGDDDPVKPYPGGDQIYADVWKQGEMSYGGTGLANFQYKTYQSVGYVRFKDADAEVITVTDTVEMTIKRMSVSRFLYLTNYETTVFGEVIKFWSQDTLDGWVHSNDTISMMQSPVFYSYVSTTAPFFNLIGGANPQFLGPPPMFNYQEIILPTTAEEIRNAAQAGGTFFTDNNGTLASILVFEGQQGWKLYQSPLSNPSMDSLVGFGDIPNWEAIFVDGYLELSGIVAGQVTVGASGGAKGWIRLMDDIRYYFANPLNGNFNDTTGGYTDILGIVSEGDIVIANSWANGRENQVQGSNIIITAAMVALNESFTFEDQNDNYIWEYSQGYISSTWTDERGIIYLRGGVTQNRRGYVHRNNHGQTGGPQGGTGYGKQYHFDARLNYMSPPYFIDAVGSEGSAQFEIVSWGNRLWN